MKQKLEKLRKLGLVTLKGFKTGWEAGMIITRDDGYHKSFEFESPDPEKAIDGLIKELKKEKLLLLK